MECQSLRASGKKLKEFNVAFFGASCDTVELNKKFADKLDLNFPLLCDTDKKVASKYGIMIANRFSKRVTIVVGKDGKIAAIESKVNVRSAGEQLVKMLAKLGIEPAKDAEEVPDHRNEEKTSEESSKKKV